MEEKKKPMAPNRSDSGNAANRPKPPSQKRKRPDSNKRIGELSESSKANARKRAGQAGSAAHTGMKQADSDKMEKMRRIKESMASSQAEGKKTIAPSEAAAEAQRYVQRQTPPTQKRKKQDVSPYTYDTAGGYTATRSYSSSSDNGSKTGIIIISVILMLFLIAYIIGMIVCSRGFLPNTYINDINIGGMNMQQAEEAVIHQGEVQGITFVKKNGDTVHFEGAEFGSAISIADTSVLQEAADQSAFLWFANYLSPARYTAKLVNTYDESKLAILVKNFTWGFAPPTDAYLQKQADGQYVIVPEDNGDMIDVDTLVNYTLEQVRCGQSTIKLEDCNCYLKAEKTAADLEPMLTQANTMLNMTVTYDFADRTETLDATTIVEWVSAGSDGKTVVDENAAKSWVQSHIADKYDTFVAGYTRSFKSTLQGVIDLPLGGDGIYGWQTDVQETTNQLIEYIKAGEDVTIEPVYSQRAYCRETNDIGTTYIEVDLTNQHVWYYVNGSLSMESACVTGLDSDPDRRTPTGVFRVWSRESPATLKGEDYETEVQYWMPVTWTGVGLHDLNRMEYGGEIYKYNGSHGCINLPIDFAEKLYNTVEVGTPVLIIP